MKTHRKHRHRWLVVLSGFGLVEGHLCETCDFAYDQLLLFNVAAYDIRSRGRVDLVEHS